jgi:hypothetical protein
MWRLLLAVPLSLLPLPWRRRIGLYQALPWTEAAILSGVIESLLALLAALYWYSRSVQTWAATALDSALRGGPEQNVPGQAMGFAALVLWLIHPLTWLILFFAAEGMVRMLAAFSTGEIFATAPLALLAWCYRKAAGRPLQAEAVDTPTVREHLQSFLAAVKERVLIARVAEVPDELIEAPGRSAGVEIHSSRPKAEWIPPRIIRIGEGYFRLERVEQRKSARPFVFILTKLPAGVPGRRVICYRAPKPGQP